MRDGTTAGKGEIMFGEQWLAVIKAEREREIKANQRAHLVDRNRLDEESERTTSTGADQSIQRAVRPVVQPGRATPDPSL
jgi:hypothetical protein